MSLRSDANLVRNATQIDPPENDEERVGGLFQDIAKVSETVDTISDLRSFDTRDLNNGDIIRVLGHTNVGIGGGYFKWITTSLFDTTETLTAASNSNGQLKTVSALTRAIWGESQSGQKIRFSNGVRAMKTSHQLSGVYETAQNVSEVGDTEVRLVMLSEVPAGESAYFDDDDGVIIRPTYTGFDGHGYYERILGKNEIVDPMMYGAIPNGSPYAGAVNDSHDALEACFNSIYDVVMRGGSYYTSAPIVMRTHKNIHTVGMSFKANGDSNDRHSHPFTGNKGIIYCVNDHDILLVKTGGSFQFSLSTQSATTHTSAGMRVDISYLCDVDADIEFIGNFETFRNSDSEGTRVFIGDDTFASASNANGTFSNDDFDIEQENFDVYNFNVGSLSPTKINVQANYCHTMIYITEQSDSNNTWINTLWMNVHGSWCKKGLDIKGNPNMTIVTGTLQNNFVFNTPLSTRAENLKTVNTIGCGNCWYDMYVHDLRGEQDGFYKHDKDAEFLSSGVRLGPSAWYNKDNRHLNEEMVQGHHDGAVANSDFVMGKITRQGGDRPMISRLLNTLAFADLRGATISATAYENTSGYDYEANTGQTSGLTVDSNVTVSNTNNFLSHTPVSATEISFNASGSEDSFVEFFIDVTGMSGYNTTGRYYVTFECQDFTPKKIQVIDSSGSQILREIPKVDNITFGTDTFTFRFRAQGYLTSPDNIIIRFIGSQEGETGSIFFHDFATRYAQINSFIPYVHKQGDQRIYGDLEANQITGTNVVIKDGANTYQPVKKIKEITLTSSDILSSNTTPILVLDSEDNGGEVENIIITDCWWTGEGGSTQYSTNTNMQLLLDGNAFAEIDLSSLPTLDNRFYTDYQRPTGQLFTDFNRTVTLQTETGDPTGGDISIKVYVEYKKLF